MREASPEEVAAALALLQQALAGLGAGFGLRFRVEGISWDVEGFFFSSIRIIAWGSMVSGLSRLCLQV